MFLIKLYDLCLLITFQNKLNEHAKVFHDESLAPKEGVSKQDTAGNNAEWVYWNSDKTQSHSSEDSAAVRNIQGTCCFLYILF